MQSRSLTVASRATKIELHESIQFWFNSSLRARRMSSHVKASLDIKLVLFYQSYAPLTIQYDQGCQEKSRSERRIRSFTAFSGELKLYCHNCASENGWNRILPTEKRRHQVFCDEQLVFIAETDSFFEGIISEETIKYRNLFETTRTFCKVGRSRPCNLPLRGSPTVREVPSLLFLNVEPKQWLFWNPCILFVLIVHLQDNRKDAPTDY